MEITKEIETPVAKHKVVIKTMLTGAERETVENAEMAFVKTSDGKNFEVTDMGKVAVARKHQLLQVSVVSIDTDTTQVLERLRKMYEQDYDYVYNEIVAAQKKMKEPISPTSS